VHEKGRFAAQKKLIPDFSGGPVIELRSIKAVPEYQVIVSRKE